MVFCSNSSLSVRDHQLLTLSRKIVSKEWLLLKSHPPKFEKGTIKTTQLYRQKMTVLSDQRFSLITAKLNCINRRLIRTLTQAPDDNLL